MSAVHLKVSWCKGGGWQPCRSHFHHRAAYHDECAFDGKAIPDVEKEIAAKRMIKSAIASIKAITATTGLSTVAADVWTGSDDAPRYPYKLARKEIVDSLASLETGYTGQKRKKGYKQAACNPLNFLVGRE